MRMFKLNSMMLMLIMMCMSVTASAYDFTVDGIYYQNYGSYSPYHYDENGNYVSDGYYEHAVFVAPLFEGNSSNAAAYSGDVVIPETVTYDGTTYTVCGVRSYAFYYCGDVNSVQLPSTVSRIEYGAFEYCTQLTSVDMPGVKELSGEAFSGCTSLTSITIPERCTYLSDWMFSGCTSLQNVTLPSTLTSIRSYVFCGCSSLESITIPDNVNSIGSNAFQGCQNLTSVTLPSKLTSISEQAFYGCQKLNNVTLPGSIISVGNNAFYGCSSLQSINFPEGMTTIGDCAFQNCTGITSVNIPSTLIYIGNNAFVDTNVSSYTVTEGNTKYSAEDGVLYSANKVQLIAYPTARQGDFVIPSTVTGIGSYTFSGCSGLTGVTIPSSVTTISDYAFNGCSSITSVVIEDGEKTLTMGQGNYSCRNDCQGGLFGESYLNSLYIGRNLKFTNESAEYTPFTCQHFLTNITIGANITSFPANTFYNCYMYCMEDMENTSTLNLKGGLKQWLTFDRSKENSFPSVGNILFDGQNLSGDIVIPEGVTELPSYAFSFPCGEVKSITISKDITSIADGAFSGLTNLEKAYVAEGNTAFCAIDDIIFNAEKTKIVLFPTLKSGELTLPDGITEVASYQFKGNKGLTKISLPNTVKKIGSYAFYGCEALGKLNIGDGVESIGSYAFANCAKLDSLSLSENVETLGSNAFENDSLMNYVYLGKKLTKINGYTFYNCQKLTSLTIPASVQSVGNYVFSYCRSLKNLIIEDSKEPLAMGNYCYFDYDKNNYRAKYSNNSYYTYWNDNNKYYTIEPFTSSPLTEIYVGRNIQYENRMWGSSYDDWSTSVFAHQRSLKKITFGDNVTEINKYMCHDTSLDSVIIGSSVKTIHENAFCECGNINYLSLGESLQEIKSYAFNSTWSLNTLDYKGTIAQWCGISFADYDAYPLKGGMGGSQNFYINGEELPTNLEIPDGVTSVGSYCFYGMNSIATVKLPASVKTIGENAFNASLMAKVDLDSSDPATIASTNSFCSDAYFFVPDDAVDAYKTADVWSDMADRIFGQSDFFKEVNLTAMSSSPALLPAIGGDKNTGKIISLKINGTMNGYDIMVLRNKMKHLRYLDLSDVTMEANDYEYYTGYHTSDSIISDYSFYDMDNLRSVILPKNIKSIGRAAFASCNKLSSVTGMPESCTYISDYAFAYNDGCWRENQSDGSSLKHITIGAGVTNMGSYVFDNCSNLESVYISRKLTNIPYYTFEGCSSLKQVIIPESVESIEDQAFENCYNIDSLGFTKGLKYISSSAFRNCTGLKSLHLPSSVLQIGYYAFNGCSGLSEVHLPEVLNSVGDYAFTNCGLKSVYAYTVFPVKINQNTFNYDGVTLYAPDQSYWNYYLDTQWSQFENIYEFQAKYDEWYTPVNTDLEINTDEAIIKSQDAAGSDGTMEPGSGLIFVGSGKQLIKDLTMKWGWGEDNYPTLIDGNNLDVEKLKFLMNVQYGRWYFFCFPFDVELKNVEMNGKWVWRYYDSQTRADNGYGGWKDVTDDKLYANVGYIFQARDAGNLTIPISNPVFGDPDKEVTLKTYSSATDQIQDASWNFIGNPNLSYYDLSSFIDYYQAPITVWNVDNCTYDAVVPGDDNYQLHPFEAFFVQKPNDKNDIEFLGENRLTYTQAQKTSQANAKALAKKNYATDGKRMMLNISLTNGQQTDKTRVVFNDEKSFDYEPSCDATKFLSDAGVPQLYTIDRRNVKCSINERPNGSHEVKVGYSVSSAGTYTIKADRMDCLMAIKDLETGTLHNFADGDYEFESEAGTFDNRFMLVNAADKTNKIGPLFEGDMEIMPVNGGISVNGIDGHIVTVYNTAGMKIATLTSDGTVDVPTGVYIVSTGKTSSKVTVK